MFGLVPHLAKQHMRRMEVLGLQSQYVDNWGYQVWFILEKLFCICISITWILTYRIYWIRDMKKKKSITCACNQTRSRKNKQTGSLMKSLERCPPVLSQCLSPYSLSLPLLSHGSVSFLKSLLLILTEDTLSPVAIL